MTDDAIKLLLYKSANFEVNVIAVQERKGIRMGQISAIWMFQAMLCVFNKDFLMENTICTLKQ